MLWKAEVGFDTDCTGGWGADVVRFWRNDLQLSDYGLSFYLTYNGSTDNAPRSAVDTPFKTRTFGRSVHVSGSATLELRKTGKTPTSGPVSAGDKLAYFITGAQPDGYGWTQYFVRRLSNIRFVKYTCDIDAGSRNIPVTLGDVRADRFTGVGSTSPDENFKIGLTCTQPTGAYNVNLTFSATPDASQAPGVLALSGGAEAASGIGVQLLMHGQPVKFGSALKAGSASGDATFSIPMTARYYQTGGAIKPGKADGIATFAVSYK